MLKVGSVHPLHEAGDKGEKEASTLKAVWEFKLISPNKQGLNSMKPVGRKSNSKIMLNWSEMVGYNDKIQ